MIKLGLERISLLLKDVPLSWRAIHVAGTNGKGSICGYISAVLQAANIRTGRFTSPHFIDRWDGICVNGEPVAKDVFLEVEETIKQKNEKHAINASEFEILTATAFEVFNREKVQIGVVEVGMGGLHDATNVLERPLVTVISQIGLDHQAFLGDTLPEIAIQKAGIMKEGVPCVVDGHNDEAVLQVFRDCAKRHKSELVVTPVGFVQPFLGEDESLDFCIGSQLTTHTAMGRNMWCAYNALLSAAAQLSTTSNDDELFIQNPPTDQALRDIIKKGTMLLGSLPGRFQSISLEPIASRKEDALIDGAHNKEAWTVLGDFIERQLRSRQRGPVTWVFALSGGRSPESFVKHCWVIGDNLVAVEFGPVEGMPWVQPTSSSELVEIFIPITSAHGSIVSCGKDVPRALRTAADIAKEGPLVICGSLYLVSDVLRVLRTANEPPIM